MVKWSRDKVDSENLNNGNEYDKNSQVALQELNAMVNSGLYAQDFAEHLADEPDTTDINNVGTPRVDFVSHPDATINKPYKRFKFSNFKGETGESGNGIVSIQKTSTSGLVDTYTIIFDNGSTSTFTITNGKNGENVELRVADDYIQWKYTDSPTWNNLIAISSLITIDSEFSTKSTNAVQNKVVTARFNDIATDLNNKMDKSTIKRFSAFGSVDMLNGGIRGLIEYVRLTPKSGYLSGTISLETSSSWDEFTLMRLDTLSSLLGVSFKTPASNYQTGSWNFTTGGTLEYNWGQVLNVMTSGVIEAGRYYRADGAYGGWSQGTMGGHNINFSNVWLEEN